MGLYRWSYIFRLWGDIGGPMFLDYGAGKGSIFEYGVGKIDWLCL